jgi:hypothetical protein
MKVLIAGILGGIVVFIWGAITHMVLPLGEMGIQSLPHEDEIVGELKEGISESGLYFFPGMDKSRDLSPEEQKAWEAKYMAGPTGLLVYHPIGSKPLGAKQLLGELGADIAAALLAAYILSFIVASFTQRVLLVGLLGLIAWLCVSVSYWNWYGFPAPYILAEGIDQFVGWLLAGMPMAAIVKPGAR